MINIITTNTYSKLEFLPVGPEEMESHQKCVGELHRRMGVFDPDAKYSEKYNSFTKEGKRIWDGYIRFFNASNFSFLTGHLPFIIQIIENQGLEYTIVDRCYIPIVPINPVFKLKDIELRPYQQDGVKIAIEHRSRGIFYQATNAGKTIMAIAICESIPVRTLFLVDRVELLRQTFDKFKKYSSREIGVITPNEFEPREITIGLQKTIWSRLRNKFTREDFTDYLNSVEMFFADEVHKASSTTWRYVLRNMHRAYYRYGLSGTPLLDHTIRDMFLVGFIGRVIQRISNSYLIEHGYSAEPFISLLHYSNDVLPRALDYAEVYRVGICENTKRNQRIVETIKSHPGKTILVIVRHLDHGHLIRNELAKDESYFVSGQDTKSDRISIYNRFKNKKIPIVIASMIYKEGIDISAIDVLIYAAGEKAPVTILQVLGRGLRTRDDKKVLIFYDFNDQGHIHLKRHTRKRLNIYENEGFTVEKVQMT